MKKCGALLLFLLCLCECGVQGERERVLTMEQRLTLLEARLSAVVSSMDHEAEADLREYYEKKMDGLAKQNEELQSRLDSSENLTQVLQSNMETLKTQIEDCALVKDDLANLTERYGYLESRYHQLQTQVDQFQSGYQQLVINPEGRKKRLCETDGFTWDGGVCYYNSYYLSLEAGKSWDESRRFCRDKQADLIIISSQEKQDLLVRVAPSNTDVWIGSSDRDTEGSFKWVDGTPLSSPRFWRPGQPDRTVNENCVYYANRGVSDRGWGDWICSSSLQWMCERVVQ